MPPPPPCSLSIFRLLFFLRPLPRAAARATRRSNAAVRCSSLRPVSERIWQGASRVSARNCKTYGDTSNHFSKMAKQAKPARSRGVEYFLDVVEFRELLPCKVGRLFSFRPCVDFTESRRRGAAAGRGSHSRTPRGQRGGCRGRTGSGGGAARRGSAGQRWA